MEGLRLPCGRGTLVKKRRVKIRRKEGRKKCIIHILHKTRGIDPSASAGVSSQNVYDCSEMFQDQSVNPCKLTYPQKPGTQFVLVKCISLAVLILKMELEKQTVILSSFSI